MSEPNIDPDGPSPWVACPECACTWFRMTANLERGRWTDDGQYVIQPQPHPGAWTVGPEDPLTCRDCGAEVPTPHSDGHEYNEEGER